MTTIAAAAGAIGIGSTVLGGVSKIQAADVNAQAGQIGIQQQILQTIGTAFGFGVQAQQYGYAANIAKYQAAVSDMNQQIALGNATYARDVGEVQAQQSAMKSREDLGMMKASQGASGMDVNSGSAINVRESMIDIGYYNQAVIRSDAARKAYGFEVEAMQAGAQADVYRYTAQQDEAQATNALAGKAIVEQALPLEQQAAGLITQAKDISITGSIASTVGSVASKWMDASSKGLFGSSTTG